MPYPQPGYYYAMPPYGVPVMSPYSSPAPPQQPYDSPSFLEQFYVGKTHMVILKEYTPTGIKVQFSPPRPSKFGKYSSFVLTFQAPDIKPNIELVGMLQWNVFARPIQAMDPEERLKFCMQRVPIGSRFPVYVNTVDTNGEMILTLAMRPTPLLNYTEEDGKESI